MAISFHATTICAVRHNGKTAMAGDGQVTMGEKVIMKGTAHKVRKIYDGKVVVGFAGSVADAFNLEDRFEKKLNQYSGNLQRAAVELAQEWRSDQALQKLEALLIVMDAKNLLLAVRQEGENSWFVLLRFDPTTTFWQSGRAETTLWPLQKP